MRVCDPRTRSGFFGAVHPVSGPRCHSVRRGEQPFTPSFHDERSDDRSHAPSLRECPSGTTSSHSEFAPSRRHARRAESPSHSELSDRKPKEAEKIILPPLPDIAGFKRWC